MTKAKTLTSLKFKLKNSHLLEMIIISYSDWSNIREKVLKEIIKNLDGNEIFAVRSSAVDEDGEISSNAGHYKSLLNVDKSRLAESIDEVFNSYGNIPPHSEVFVQPMLRNVLSSGVVFSHDPNTFSPYIVVNMSHGTLTDSVTSGMGGEVWYHHINSPIKPSLEIQSIVDMVIELLEIFEGKPLDCEFALIEDSEKNLPVLLQVRPLILLESPVDIYVHTNWLNTIHEKIKLGMEPHPFLLGKKNIFSVMSDWNPAEIIGIRPKPLALSIYRELITDSTWAYQRHNYGYRNLRSFHLLQSFHGLPYIDVRLSFNSFIPASLDTSIATRLVDFYISKLSASPAMHDKVEFEIVYSCYTFDLPDRIEELLDHGFSSDNIKEISSSLLNLTNKILNPRDGLWRSDAAKIDTLTLRRETIVNSRLDSLEKIYWLMEDAKRYGALPFAGLARAGFIAVQLLKSLVSVGVFSKEDYDNFLAGVNTVSGDLNEDRIILDKVSFLNKYGHLRPGTYEITSPKYKDASDLYFDWSSKSQKIDNKKEFSLKLNQMRDIASLLNNHQIDSDPIELLEFIKSAIEYRELSKFHFTKNISDILSLIQNLGSNFDIDLNELSYLEFQSLNSLHFSSMDHKSTLISVINNGVTNYSITNKIHLPPVIIDPNDIWSYKMPNSIPNFITQKNVTANITLLTQGNNLNSKIVLITNADPGFDWIFSHSISGLITMWGGINSHMAIRAGELGVPAVIGIGELKFDALKKATVVNIDCSGKRIEIIK